MKLRYQGSIAILGAMLLSACVSATEQSETEVMAAADKAPVIQVAANDVKVDSEGRELDEDGFPIPKQKKKLGKAPPTPEGAMSPMERVKSAPIGTLKNPYKHDLNGMAKWGKARYMGNSCNGCHGGTGGGGMCPPLSNATWVYGNDDDTLFRLIALGSVDLQKHLGTSRKGRENVVGPMPAFGGIIKTDDEIWRIISFIRTIYNDDPSGDARNVH
jgi:mono/diheme cytochrome c family protein